VNGQPVRPPRVASRRLTSATLTAGVLAAASCFVVAGAAEFTGRATDPGSMTDLAVLVSGLWALDPWAWASLGTFAVVATPALGLVATAWEYAQAADRSAFALALAVLAILVLSGLIAVLR